MFGVILLGLYLWCVLKFYRWHKQHGRILKAPKLYYLKTEHGLEPRVMPGMDKVLGKDDYRDLIRFARKITPLYKESEAQCTSEEHSS